MTRLDEDEAFLILRYDSLPLPESATRALYMATTLIERAALGLGDRLAGDPIVNLVLLASRVEAAAIQIDHATRDATAANGAGS